MHLYIVFLLSFALVNFNEKTTLHRKFSEHYSDSMKLKHFSTNFLWRINDTKLIKYFIRIQSVVIFL